MAGLTLLNLDIDNGQGCEVLVLATAVRIRSGLFFFSKKAIEKLQNFTVNHPQITTFTSKSNMFKKIAYHGIGNESSEF